MEKISSILPGNPRVHSVDLEDAPPARPGAPTFGRKAGRNTVNDRITLSAKAKELAAQDTMMTKNPKEASRAKMVEELNRRFFETRLQKPEKEVPQTAQIADKVIEAADQNFGDLRETISQYEMPEETKATRLSVEA
jgi:hypothetical protein